MKKLRRDQKRQRRCASRVARSTRRSANRRARRPEGADTSTVLARVRDGLALVRAIAAKIASVHPIEAREAAAFGHVALVIAARGFDPRYGVPFAAWAAIRVRGAILDGLRREGRFPIRRGGAEKKAERIARRLAGMQTAAEIGLVGDGPERWDERATSPERALLDAEEHRELRRALVCLSPVQRALVESHYFRGESLSHAAERVGLSKSWASRLHADALRRLRREMHRAPLRLCSVGSTTRTAGGI